MNQYDRQNLFLKAKQNIDTANGHGTIEYIEQYKYGKDFIEHYINDLFEFCKYDIDQIRIEIESRLFTELFLGSWSSYVSTKSIDDKIAKEQAEKEKTYASETPPIGWLPKGYDPKRHGVFTEIELQNFWDAEKRYSESAFANVAFPEAEERLRMNRF